MGYKFILECTRGHHLLPVCGVSFQRLLEFLVLITSFYLFNLSEHFPLLGEAKDFWGTATGERMDLGYMGWGGFWWE